MTPQARVGGFKILKDVAWISLTAPQHYRGFPTEFCRLLAQEQINLPFLTCGSQDGVWGLNIVVDAKATSSVSDMVRERFDESVVKSDRAVILSIFPHKSDPEITGALFEVFAKEGVVLRALGHSNSAISVVLGEKDMGKATSGLFTPFRFSAYRTPEDWRLAQKGKEELYKEVVASYQEKKPKVYALEYREKQDIIQISLKGTDVGSFGATFKELARLGLNLTFLATSPCQERGREMLMFCLPASMGHIYKKFIKEIAPGSGPMPPAGIFSMNGPHFGDRYGIASELLTAFQENKIDLLGLSCTVASILGVVPSNQMESTIRTIQHCFEVPAVLKKDD